MTLSEEHKIRAHEIFESFIEIQKEIKENEEKINQLSEVQQNLINRVNQVRESEQEWIRKIADETGETEGNINKEIANYIMTTFNITT